MATIDLDSTDADDLTPEQLARMRQLVGSATMRATIKDRTKAETAALVAKMNAGRKRNEATKAGRRRRSELNRKAGLAAGVARRKRAAERKAAEEVPASRAAGAGEEIARRIEDIDCGKAKMIPWSEFRRELMEDRDERADA